MKAVPAGSGKIALQRVSGRFCADRETVECASESINEAESFVAHCVSGCQSVQGMSMLLITQCRLIEEVCAADGNPESDGGMLPVSSLEGAMCKQTLLHF